MTGEALVSSVLVIDRMFDLKNVKSFYEDYGNRISAVRRVFGRPLTLSEKILYSHYFDLSSLRPLKNREDVGAFRPDLLEPLVPSPARCEVVLEKFAFPGGLLLGPGTCAPGAGGMGMLAFGTDAAGVAEVTAGRAWMLRMPRLIGVRLTGTLKSWASPKDVILKLTGMLTAQGGRDAVIEYFGPGTENISCAGKATICKMGAETGAIGSVFPFGVHIAEYLAATGRAEVAAMASALSAELRADDAVTVRPEQYFDEVLQINLSELEPYVNGPLSPDAACPLSGMKARCAQERFPLRVDLCRIGFSSYQDFARAAFVTRGALDAGLRPKAELTVVVGSARLRATAERDGLLDTLREAGAVVTDACGDCSGQPERREDDPSHVVVTTFLCKPDSYSFVVSPVMAVALAFAGELNYDPRSDTVDGVWLQAPRGENLPPRGFAPDSNDDPAPKFFVSCEPEKH